jgi:hypothetical protein
VTPGEQELTSAQQARLVERARERDRRHEVNTALTGIVRLTALAEMRIDFVLALYHARTADSVYMLYGEVLWRVPFDVRLRFLEDALEDTELSDAFPFVLPVVRKLVSLRNVLAHATPFTEVRGDGVVVASRYRGKYREELIRDEFIRWLIPQAERVVQELNLLSGRIGDLNVWMEAHGFNDRTHEGTDSATK